jgi:hypothetical protein
VCEVQAYFPLLDGSGGVFYVPARSQSPSAFSAIRAAVRQLSPALAITTLRTLDDQLDRVLVTERMLATLASAFAALALLLTVVGLYGVMSFVVSRRTRGSESASRWAPHRAKRYGWSSGKPRSWQQRGLPSHFRRYGRSAV